MSRFMNNFIVYQSKKVLVYINQCHNPGKKTKVFSIRRDDKRASGHLLGLIRFSGAWRQYVTEFEPKTIWSAGCKKKIAEFEELLNKQFRDNLKMKRKEKPYSIFQFRMDMLFEAHRKHLFWKITKKLMKETSVEEKDSILMGLLDSHSVQEANNG